MPLECHTWTVNAIELQLPDTVAVADINMLQCSAQLRILFINAHFAADNSSPELASSATVKPTFNVAEEVVVIRNGCLQRRGRRRGKRESRFNQLMRSEVSMSPPYS